MVLRPRVYIALGCICLVAVGIYLTVYQQDQKPETKPPSKAPDSSCADAPTRPYTLTIDKLQIRAAIESVGLDPEGNMDTPKIPLQVGWYSLGPRPGETGNVVIAGHYDQSDGTPDIFYELDQLKAGDVVSVTDTCGQQHTYQINSNTVYPFDQSPLQTIFGPSDSSTLHLITCAGSWDAKDQNYDKRTVVTAHLVQ